MKLTKVTPYVINVPPPNYGGYQWYFLKLETDNGLVGWGETAVLFSLLNMDKAFTSLVEGLFDRFLKGQDPMNREMLNKLMFTGFSSHRTGYVEAGLISAFDMAMWDIVGKQLGVPVCNLLGGKFRDRLRSYTYIMDYSWTADDDLMAAATELWGSPQKTADMARKLVDEGFTGLKLDPLRYILPGTAPITPWEVDQKELDQAERMIEAIRKAVGNDADIMIGTHGQITPSVSRRFARRIEQFDPLWLEEPCPADNADEMARIRSATTIPIAGGERFAYVHDFERAFAVGALHFAQPDLGACGGITAAKQISALAEAHYVLMAPHVWGGPLITAAAIQVSASIPNFLIQESIYKSGLFHGEICKEPLVWEDGDLLVPDTPGLGIELDEDVLEKYISPASR